MINKHGFTLVEILLAVMIVGIIGVALAAITTAALRESGVGRTRMILRNQLSIALRQLRQDIQLADSAQIDSGSTLTLSFNLPKAGANVDATKNQVTYSFTAGTENALGSTQENPATIGGIIYRTVNGGTPEVWLGNVKKISKGTDHYPSFTLVGAGNGNDSRVRVRLVVQADSMPVVNDYVDMTFFMPKGVGICDPCLAGAISCGTTATCN